MANSADRKLPGSYESAEQKLAGLEAKTACGHAAKFIYLPDEDGYVCVMCAKESSDAELASLRSQLSACQRELEEVRDCFKHESAMYSAAQQQLQQMKEALKNLWVLLRDPQNATESFERIGEMYYRFSGRLRPGKSEALATGRDSNDKANVEQFNHWYDENYEAAYVSARALLSGKGE